MKLSTDFTALNRAFNEIIASKLNGVSGVWVARSARPGPVVGITIGTHGNEPSGLAAYWYYRHVYQLEHQLQSGTVIFILNNICAMASYLDAVAQNDEARKRQARFVDLNMNRLPDDVFDRDDDQRYEVRRANELRPVWSMIEYGLDLHSTLATSDPQVIALERSSIDMVRRFPIVTVIKNIDAIQTGKPASYFYGNGKAAVYGIEGGKHEQRATFVRTAECVKQFLMELAMLKRRRTHPKRVQRVYSIFSSVLFPNSSYELTEVLPSFKRIEKGHLIAKGDQGPILAPSRCYTINACPFKKPPKEGDELMFLSRPPKLLKARRLKK
ncbi:MAG TPA: succinylglutamate desuccinylase/aspartoacylase family protein [Candidatus Paceibacterota bacterium]|nr:succinylglutamate desuccinylase/aspartoacylase family protein [Candidatus Paceibacterota bacterium]